MEQAASLQASTIGQMEVAKWIDMFDLDGHVTKIRECYRKRRTVMLDTLERELPKECTFTIPTAACSRGSSCRSTWTRRICR